MRTSISHLSDTAVLARTDEVLSRERGTTAELLICLAEVDSRKLYVPHGYSSMYLWCVDAKHMSPDEAYKRIRVARAARRFPSILEAIAEGRLHLTAVVLLAPYLNRRNGDELLAAAVHKSKDQVLTLIAQQFPQPDLPSRMASIAPAPRAEQIHSMALVPEPVQMAELAPSAPGQIEPPVAPSRITPLAPERFGFQTTIGKRVHDKVREAQELLSHQFATNDFESLLECLLDLSLPQLRKQKHAATDKPRVQKPRKSSNPRYIPNAVKQAVWERDGGRCTFVSESGHRCEARTLIEFDHVDPVARGGYATVRNTRLRCHAHNQYEAEKIFGAAFMEAKRGVASNA